MKHLFFTVLLLCLGLLANGQTTVSANKVKAKKQLQVGTTKIRGISTKVDGFTEARKDSLVTQKTIKEYVDAQAGDDWGESVVYHDSTLIGSGTMLDLLKVDTTKIATKNFVEDEVVAIENQLQNKLDNVIAGENVTIDYTNQSEPIVSVPKNTTFPLRHESDDFDWWFYQGVTPAAQILSNLNFGASIRNRLGISVGSSSAPSIVFNTFASTSPLVSYSTRFGVLYDTSYDDYDNIGFCSNRNGFAINGGDATFFLGDNKIDLIDLRQTRVGLQMWGYGENSSGLGGNYSNLAPNAFAPVSLAVQSLSLVGNQLTISGGNTVSLPEQGASLDIGSSENVLIDVSDPEAPIISTSNDVFYIDSIPQLASLQAKNTDIAIIDSLCTSARYDYVDGGWQLTRKPSSDIVLNSYELVSVDVTGLFETDYYTELDEGSSMSLDTIKVNGSVVYSTPLVVVNNAGDTRADIVSKVEILGEQLSESLEEAGYSLILEISVSSENNEDTDTGFMEVEFFMYIYSINAGEFIDITMSSSLDGEYTISAIHDDVYDDDLKFLQISASNVVRKATLYDKYSSYKGISNNGSFSFYVSTISHPNLKLESCSGETIEIPLKFNDDTGTYDRRYDTYWNDGEVCYVSKSADGEGVVGNRLKPFFSISQPVYAQEYSEELLLIKVVGVGSYSGNISFTHSNLENVSTIVIEGSKAASLATSITSIPVGKKVIIRNFNKVVFGQFKVGSGELIIKDVTELTCNYERPVIDGGKLEIDVDEMNFLETLTAIHVHKYARTLFMTKSDSSIVDMKIKECKATHFLFSVQSDKSFVNFTGFNKDSLVSIDVRLDIGRLSFWNNSNTNILEFKDCGYIDSNLKVDVEELVGNIDNKPGWLKVDVTNSVYANKNTNFSLRIGKAKSSRPIINYLRDLHSETSLLEVHCDNCVSTNPNFGPVFDGTSGGTNPPDMDLRITGRYTSLYAPVLKTTANECIWRGMLSGTFITLAPGQPVIEVNRFSLGEGTFLLKNSTLINDGTVSPIKTNPAQSDAGSINVINTYANSEHPIPTNFVQRIETIVQSQYVK